MSIATEKLNSNNLMMELPLIIRNHIHGIIESIKPDTPLNGLLKNSVTYSLECEGKYKRSVLLYLSYLCFSKDCLDDNLKYIAASIELMHNASLIHDDIIDHGLIRRGRESVVKKFGETTALLTGDYLIFSSMRIASLAASEQKSLLNILNKMNSTYCSLCSGQVMENDLIGNLDFEIEKYLEVIRLKTAVFFEMICEVAGIYAGASPVEIKAIYNFGHNIGMAYQIRDDVMSFMPAQKNKDKSITSDFERKLVTLPILISYKNGNRNQKELLRKYYLSDYKWDWALMCKTLEDTNALNETIKYIAYYVNTAKDCLSTLAPCTATDLLSSYAESLLI